MEYSRWKSIGAARAVRAVEGAAEVWRLPAPFYSSGTAFTHGLRTRRGTRYVVSQWVMSSVADALAKREARAVSE